MGKSISAVPKVTPLGKSSFPLLCGVFGKSRNMVVFNGKSLNQNLPKEIMNQVLEFIYCVHSPRSSNQKINRRLR